MHYSFACAIAALCPALAVAQTDCRSIESDLDRLACYDLESGRAHESIAASTEGAWRVRSERSEMTDDPNVYVTVASDDPLPCRFASPENAMLVLRCQENTTSVIISTTGCHLASSDYNNYGVVTYRLDEAPSSTRDFVESTDNRALGLWSGGEAIPFIKDLFGHRELLTRFTPFNDSPVTARFSIAAVEEAVAPLREACGW
jgi:type VI secretion system protein VasI